MKKRISYVVLIAGLVLNFLLGAQVYFRAAEAAEKDDPWYHLELFTRVLEQVREEYVDGEELTYQDLIYAALEGMLSTLDPHSEFMDPQKYDRLREDTEGRPFGGVGIIISMRNRMLTVIEPMENTPAMHAGILPGDRIIRIEGEPTDGFQLRDAVERLRGEPGTEVEMTILRPSSSQEKVVRLKRAKIKVHRVKDLNGRREFPVDENGIGYIRLQTFDENTSEELEEALDKMESHDLAGLVLDLRDNPGGLLDQAVKVCDKFLKQGELIVMTIGRDQTDEVSYFATARDKHTDLEITILVNRNSASASEIVAGCLQDHGYAVVVGEQTFGKGSVQKILPMPRGAALRLTTSKYYTPSNKVIHGKGITPQILVGMAEEYEQALSLRRVPGAMENLDDVLNDYLPEKADLLRRLVQSATDAQLERGVESLKERLGIEVKELEVSEALSGPTEPRVENPASPPASRPKDSDEDSDSGTDPEVESPAASAADQPSVGDSDETPEAPVDEVTPVEAEPLPQ